MRPQKVALLYLFMPTQILVRRISNFACIFYYSDAWWGTQCYCTRCIYRIAKRYWAKNAFIRTGSIVRSAAMATCRQVCFARNLHSPRTEWEIHMRSIWLVLSWQRSRRQWMPLPDYLMYAKPLGRWRSGLCDAVQFSRIVNILQVKHFSRDGKRCNQAGY